MAAVEMTRRTFLVASGGVGAGLMLGVRAEALTQDKTEFKPNAFVHIGADSTVTITVAKPDIGQGVRTSLAMIVAEELGVEWESVQVRQAGVEPGLGGQGVGGSGSVRGTYGPLRQAGATAATMLQQAADARWGKSPNASSSIRIEKGMVIHGSGKTARLGEIAVEAAKLPVPEAKDVTLKSKADFTVIGKATRRVDNKDVATGKAKFGLDQKFEKKKVATVEKPYAFGGKAVSFDDTEAMKVPGVVKVMQVGPGVAVIADSTWAALKGRKALKVTWDHGPNATLDSTEIRRRFEAAVRPFPELPDGAAKTVDAIYEQPYLAHACMEPMNATVHFKGDSAEIWVPTQSPEGMRSTAARVLGLEPSQVKVNVTLAGGGFGRRGGGDFIGEAAAIAKEVDGPVQLLWTREDDMRHDNYRPANYHVLKGAVDKDGKPLAYYHQSFEAGAGGRGNQEPAWRGLRPPYKIEHGGFLSGRVESPIPTGAWRAVENSYSGLVMESFFDELCALGGKDPLEMRLELVTNDRIKRTLEMAKDKSGWGKELPKGWGRGVACFSGYGSAITQVVEVEMIGKKPMVRRVVAVVDCGVAINPLGIEAQIQGATLDAVSTTFYSEITIKDGGVQQSTFADFGWAKMADAPKVEVHIIADGDQPGGMGEVGYPAAGAAIANAIFAATGKRLRRLPLRVSDLA